jgi:hypothetical protein
MNNEQLTRASEVINNDATAHSTYFSRDGSACAVGGLYMSLHPDDEYAELHAALGLVDNGRFEGYGNQVHYDVGQAFGLRPEEVNNLTAINDLYETDDYNNQEDFPYSPSDFVAFGEPDWERFDEELESWNNEHPSEPDNEGLLHDRRTALIKWLTDLTQD